MSLFLALLSKQQNYEIYTLILLQAYNHLKDLRHAYLYKFCKVLTILPKFELDVSNPLYSSST
jgi:hypothetical protein